MLTLREWLRRREMLTVRGEADDSDDFRRGLEDACVWTRVNLQAGDILDPAKNADVSLLDSYTPLVDLATLYSKDPKTWVTPWLNVMLLGFLEDRAHHAEAGEQLV